MHSDNNSFSVKKYSEMQRWAEKSQRKITNGKDNSPWKDPWLANSDI